MSGTLSEQVAKLEREVADLREAKRNDLGVLIEIAERHGYTTIVEQAKACLKKAGL